jgi:hypothetical protein
LGNFVRGLTLSVSGFLGMSLCLNYASSASTPYLVSVGLVSVFLGVVGFVLMVSGMNRAMKSPVTDKTRDVSDIPPVRLDRQRIKEDLDLGRLDEPTAKM